MQSRAVSMGPVIIYVNYHAVHLTGKQSGTLNCDQNQKTR